MKNLVATPLLALLSLTAWPQQPPTAPAQQAQVAPKAAVSPAQLAPAGQMSELDYYKTLAEQRKSEADRAHADIMTGYAVNTGILVAVALAILAVQFVNVRSELKKSEDLIRNSVANINTALAATEGSVSAELVNLREEFADLQRVMLGQLSQETTNRTEQIATVLSDLGNKYGNRIMDLEVKNQLKRFDTRPFHRRSITPEQVKEIVENNDELEELLKHVIGKLEAGTTPETAELNIIGKKIIAMQEITGDGHVALRELIQKISPVSEEFWRKFTLLEASVTVFGLDRGIGQKKYYKIYKADGLSWQFEDVANLFA